VKSALRVLRKYFQIPGSGRRGYMGSIMIFRAVLGLIECWEVMSLGWWMCGDTLMIKKIDVTKV